MIINVTEQKNIISNDITRMGVNQSSSRLCYYGESCHPIEGTVTAYSIKGEGGKFVMKTTTTATQEQLELMRKVSQGKNSKLIAYYGTHKNEIIVKGEHVELLWQLLSYDLLQEIQYLKLMQKQMEETLIWEILDSVLQASLYLQKCGIYPQLTLKKIEFSAAMEAKLYWADILPNNGHRAYQQYFNGQKFRRALFSPEQLLEITRQSKKSLDKQKCVVFSLGMLLLQCATHKSIEIIYDYERKAFSEVRKREIMKEALSKYSADLHEVLEGALQYFPRDRYSYQDLDTKVNAHFGRHEQVNNTQQLQNAQEAEKEGRFSADIGN